VSQSNPPKTAKPSLELSNVNDSVNVPAVAQAYTRKDCACAATIPLPSVAYGFVRVPSPLVSFPPGETKTAYFSSMTHAASLGSLAGLQNGGASGVASRPPSTIPD
jgi:hypothetical protein